MESCDSRWLKPTARRSTSRRLKGSFVISREPLYGSLVFEDLVLNLPDFSDVIYAGDGVIKAVRLGIFVPISSQTVRDLPRNLPLDRVEGLVKMEILLDANIKNKLWVFLTGLLTLLVHDESDSKTFMSIPQRFNSDESSISSSLRIPDEQALPQ
ncbi:hypothetical protein Tco_0939136 [Tanacetum coccineum]|uniref:Uncharacterized protein n=1 Tax=Tanacetum coccineum TaxID=301880 RepID=A0ABQ5DLX6_9ASTR